MGRTIVALIAGLVAMVACVAVLQLLGSTLYPPAAGVDFSYHGRMRAALPHTPWQATALLVLSWTLGTLVGAYVAARIAQAHRRGVALSIGTVLPALVLVAVFPLQMPHPAWMIALTLLLPLPFALLGRELAD
jgi:hypothetical protein